MNWIDIGINLTNRRYDQDREQVINNAIEHGVTKLIITGTSVRESRKALALAQKYDCAYSTAGCHPHDAKSLDTQAIKDITSLASAKEVVAVGECGLDFNRNFSPKNQQIKAFEQQLEIAAQIEKPLFFHERDAFDTFYQIIKNRLPDLKDGVVHCFTGNKQSLKKYLDLGLFIGVTGWICDERRGQELYDIVKYIPDDRLMIETDGPYLTPRNLSPKPKDGRNEPCYLPHIAKTIAKARQQSLQHIAQISYTNSSLFFNINDKELSNK
ncbi:TatD family hydrolase [Aliikangiella sp. IMCC44359]|uniref:TatD family hydrolase n=1 Tax=Aliikangiella sp. IMCC44359 TaxID=3459125 RepID=UPI00403AB657